MALVDVIIPFYNSNISFIRKALVSVTEQTFTDWQIILINDGSKEETSKELELFLNETNDNRIIYQKTDNQGVAAARNVAINISKSKYIAFLDQDDYWHQSKLEKQIQVLETNPETSLIFSNCDDEIPSGEIVPRMLKNRERYNEKTRGQLFAMMLNSNYIPMVTVVLRRKSIVEVGLFDCNFGGVEDKELWSRFLLHRKNIHHINESLAIHRLHSSNQSKNVEQVKMDRLRLIDKIGSELENEKALAKECNWEQLRVKMTRHVYHEAVGGYHETKQFRKALMYCLPRYIGISNHSIRLFLKSLSGFFFAG